MQFALYLFRLLCGNFVQVLHPNVMVIFLLLDVHLMFTISLLGRVAILKKEKLYCCLLTKFVICRYKTCAYF